MKQTWYVKSSVFKTDRVNAHLAWYELDRVSVRSKVNEVTALRRARRSGDASLNVLRLHACHNDNWVMKIIPNYG